MQPVLTLLVVTEKEQPFLWAVLLAPIAAHRTGLRAIIRIHLDRERSRKRRLVTDEGLQFGKGPLGAHPIGSPRFLRDPLVAFAVLLALKLSPLFALSNVRQLFKSKQSVWVLLDDLFGDAAIGCRVGSGCPLQDHPSPPL